MDFRSICANLPTLETDRLMMRKISEEDINDIFYYGSNPRVSQRVSWETHQTIQDTREFVSFILDGYRQEKKALWGLELKSTGKLIGTIDFVAVNTKHMYAEIGYVLSEDHWGEALPLKRR